MSTLNLKNGVPVDGRNPLQVDDVSCAMDKESITGETITFITGAAGFTGLVSTDKRPIANLNGSRVGSFWRKDWNITTQSLGSDIIIKSVNSNTIILVSPTLDLEELYETPSSTLRYIIEIRDNKGKTAYGWIKTIAESGNQYTLDIYTESAGTNVGWVGGLGVFDTAYPSNFQIYANQTSISWTTGTVLTREIDLPDDIRNLGKFLDGLSQGDYAVDYERGVIYYKKATTDTTDTIAYTVNINRATITGGSGDFSYIDDAAFTVGSSTVAGIGAIADETSSDSIDEGDIGIPRMTLDRRLYMVPQFTTITPTITVNTAGGAYSAGDSLVGAADTNAIVLTSAVAKSGGRGIIQAIKITDLAAQNAELDIWFFNSATTATTYTANGALDVADADLLKYIGHTVINPSDYSAGADNSAATVKNINLPFLASGSTSIYACIFVRSTPTYASTADLTMAIEIEQL